MRQYIEVVIVKCSSGFGEYECKRGSDEAYDDEAYLISEIRQNADEMEMDVYELGVDNLPDYVEDIRGKIHNEPERVFAFVDGPNLYFSGVRAI